MEDSELGAWNFFMLPQKQILKQGFGCKLFSGKRSQEASRYGSEEVSQGREDNQ